MLEIDGQVIVNISSIISRYRYAFENYVYNVITTLSLAIAIQLRTTAPIYRYYTNVFIKFKLVELNLIDKVLMVISFDNLFS